MIKPQKGKRPFLIDGFSDVQIDLHPTTPAKETTLKATGSLTPGWPPLFTSKVKATC